MYQLSTSVNGKIVSFQKKLSDNLYRLPQSLCRQLLQLSQSCLEQDQISGTGQKSWGHQGWGYPVVTWGHPGPDRKHPSSRKHRFQPTPAYPRPHRRIYTLVVSCGHVTCESLSFTMNFQMFLKNYKRGQHNPHVSTWNLLLASQFRLKIAVSGAQEIELRKIREWMHMNLSNGR